jgi:hypothetical protein
MKYELTTDKKALLITDDNGNLSAVPVDNISTSIASLEKQKALQMKRYDDELTKWNAYKDFVSEK